jgi:DNA-binding transcriptional regulator YdaS (Cro superfamily)
MKNPNPGLLRAIRNAGGVRALARLIGVYHNAIRQWKLSQVPAKRAVEIERLTGVPREELRPDLYRSG